MTLFRKRGATSNTIHVYMLDSTTGQPKTGLAYDDVTAHVVRARQFILTLTLSEIGFVGAPYVSGGWYEYPQAGLYRLDLPDDIFSSNVEELVIYISAASAYMREPITIRLEFDHQAGVDDVIDEISSLGLTISNVQTAAELTRKCVTNTRQIVVATGVETIYDDDGSTPIRQITRSEPVTGTLREEATTP